MSYETGLKGTFFVKKV